MTGTIVLFSVILIIVGCLTKIIGCGIGAKMCKYTNRETLQIGVGMISRGEVALIIASKGAMLGLMGPNFLGPIVVVVVFTTIVSPILLKLSFRSKVNTESEEENQFAAPFEELMSYQENHKA
jgi:Kef-type K+ transport system membrane component KefB